MAFIYLASPYSSPLASGTPSDAATRHARYIATRDMTAQLLLVGYPIYSPIVHCHELACAAELPKDAEFWERYNFRMLSAAKCLLVYCLPGWEYSLGVRAEQHYAETHFKRTVLLHPDRVAELPSAHELLS